MRSQIAINARKYGIIHFECIRCGPANAEATVQSIPINMSRKANEQCVLIEWRQEVSRREIRFEHRRQTRLLIE